MTTQNESLPAAIQDALHRGILRRRAEREACVKAERRRQEAERAARQAAWDNFRVFATAAVGELARFAIDLPDDYPGGWGQQQRGWSVEVHIPGLAPMRAHFTRGKGSSPATVWTHCATWGEQKPWSISRLKISHGGDGEDGACRESTVVEPDWERAEWAEDLETALALAWEIEQERPRLEKEAAELDRRERQRREAREARQAAAPPPTVEEKFLLALRAFVRCHARD
ncbi:MAG TPA: hypothetical protein VFA26_00650 [Gemmataceae bacterium]|nr:hypothetical protein [Gemmataceae bacterium]